MSFWIALILTGLAMIYTGIVYIGNKGSFRNYIDPGADMYLVAAAVIVALAWVSRLWW